jgi:hypothetical protein
MLLGRCRSRTQMCLHPSLSWLSPYPRFSSSDRCKKIRRNIEYNSTVICPWGGARLVCACTQAFHAWARTQGSHPQTGAKIRHNIEYNPNFAPGVGAGAGLECACTQAFHAWARTQGSHRQTGAKIKHNIEYNPNYAPGAVPDSHVPAPKPFMPEPAPKVLIVRQVQR